MCNCGKKRMELKENNQKTTNILAIKFKYTGKSALSVIGNSSKKRYRFNFPGDIQAVDYSDAGFMMSVPVLMRIY